MSKRSSRISKLFGNGSGRISGTAERDGLRYYLLVYDTEAQRLREGPAEFLDAGDAEAAFAEAEERVREEAPLQAVMFVARSLENVRSTHPHYFDDGAERGGQTVEFLIPRP